MNENQISKMVIEAAMKVHKNLGPGLLERVYEECLTYELYKAGLKVRRQVVVPVVYDGVTLSDGYRIDILVEEKFVIELKSVEYMHGLFVAQTLTYLKLSNLKLGLLINFNVPLLKEGIKRVINGRIHED